MELLQHWRRSNLHGLRATPSEAPWKSSTPSTMAVNDKNTHHKQRKGWFRNQATSLQFHTIKPKWTHPPSPGNEVNVTPVGPVFSKKRMFIILWMADEHMFCLPLYSWNRLGIQKKVQFIVDYVCIGNLKYKGRYRMIGTHDPLWFEHKDPDGELDNSTTCHIAGAHTVLYDEDIRMVGRLEAGSYTHLLQLWDWRNQQHRASSS
ncbi:hypothetical protein Slin14017_G129950 [Septoria linicola]|nr:hypothetical protein Slin14017_G129950 [Septoria linicola]